MHVFRRLDALQTILANLLAPAAALHPHARRLFDGAGVGAGAPGVGGGGALAVSYNGAPAVAYARKRNMLDGALLWRFVALDAPMQFEIAAAIGTKVETLLDNLLEIDMMAVFT